MIKQIEKTLLEILVRENLLTPEQAAKSLREVQLSGESCSTHIVAQGLVSEDQILKVCAAHFQIDTIDLRKADMDQDIVQKVPVRFAWYYRFMPIKVEEKFLTCAVALPLDVKIQDEIRVNLGFQPKMVLAKESDIVEMLKKYYGLASDTIERILTKEPARRTPQDMDRQAIEDVEKKSEDASVIKLVNQIILEAYKKRATDIHIEPYRNKLRFRYRIDGVLVDANLPADIRHFLPSILSRIKIMSNLSIVEKRLPQDGSAVVKTKDQTLDLRVSTMPTPSGESMVLRILPSKVMLLSLEKLGLDQENVKKFRELIKKPHGIIFVTGPTGSGKTTTLYACLHEINSLERKIITIEDPIEYEMEGVTQIQVNAKVDLDFARGLRSILRHDPDIIMVGEVRDIETAEIAIRTALTGHLVFSTLHTNDAASGVTRLIDMGLEPYLVASSVEAFVAQRLVRLICPYCKNQVMSPFLEVKKEISEALGLKIEDIKFYSGKGCDRCNHTGFYGRTAIHEVLIVTEKIRAAILEKPRTNYIKHLAMQEGMMTLRQNGWQKVVEGITTPMEILNVTSKEDYGPKKGEPGKNKEALGPEGKGHSVSDEAIGEFRTISKNVMTQARKEYDQRAYSRIKEKVKIRYRVFEEESTDSQDLKIKRGEIEHSSQTKNISAGGLLFTSSYSIAAGSILELKIHFKSDQPSIDCLAKVCRVEEDVLSNMYSIAVYFLDISSADRAHIKDFVNARISP
ncbi:MAG: ATPase, T2SS/T4P/T4SS family [Candidatus Omnitrophota bacterium]